MSIDKVYLLNSSVKIFKTFFPWHSKVRYNYRISSEDYVMKRIFPRHMNIVTVIVIVSTLLLNTGCDFDQSTLESLLPAPTRETSTPTDLPSEFDLVAEAWKTISSTYVNKEDIDPKKLSEGAVRGMMEALGDQYSFYVDPESAKLEMSSLRGTYYGIGAYVGLTDDVVSIVTPIANSPAEKAGLKTGDKILEINGESTKGMNLSEAALKIQGPKGTTVTLLILKKGEEKAVTINVVRDEIKIESVSTKMVDNIAYIRLTQFMAASSNELTKAIKDAIDKKAAGIVLDFRNNPGGLLDSAVNIASQFLTQGTVVDVVDNNGTHSPLKVVRGGIAPNIPLVVLVNSGSASASEVVAGALQDYGRAKLIGTQTHGKGSVQIIKSLSNGSSLHITMAKWYTPLGRPINGVGLTPDVKSELEGDKLIDFAVDYLKKQIESMPQKAS